MFDSLQECQRMFYINFSFAESPFPMQPGELQYGTDRQNYMILLFLQVYYI